MLSGNRLRVDALRLRIGFSKPVCPSRWPRGISIAVSEPNCPSQPVSDSLLGIKTLHSEPAGPSELALWLNFGISEPKHRTCTPLQGPPGLKIALPEPARPFPVPLARVAGPEQERAALSAVADSGKPLPLQPFGSACPSTRSGCAVPCGTSRSQARVPSLPGPANPALSASGKPLTACCPARISRWAFKMITKSRNRYSAF